MKKNYKKLAIFTALILITSVITWYFVYTGTPFYISPNNNETKNGILGLAGDYFGGILNPFFGFITILLLLWQNNVQHKEIMEGRNVNIREELKKTIENIEEQIETEKEKNFSEPLKLKCLFQKTKVANSFAEIINDPDRLGAFAYYITHGKKNSYTHVEIQLYHKIRRIHKLSEKMLELIEELVDYLPTRSIKSHWVNKVDKQCVILEDHKLDESKYIRQKIDILKEKINI